MILCGLEESPEKSSPPITEMFFLRLLHDSVRLTVSIDRLRLTEILGLVEEWLGREMAALREVQSIIGKLNLVASCVRPGRIFISRS